jgi:hypothetical protein
MSAMIVEVCRANTTEDLQKVMGGTLHHWAQFGFKQVNVDFVSPGDDMLGVYVSSAGAARQQLLVQAAEDFTAVLVLSKA